jgi:hypothetical protein
MSPTLPTRLFESSLPKWLACTDELAAGIQHHPRQKALKRAYIDTTPRRWFGPWCSTWTAQRPPAWQDALRSALGPTGSPRTPERSCASGLRAGLSGVQDTESTGDPSTVLGSHSARPDHGPRCGQGLHPPADQDPRPSHLAHILGSALTPTSWEYVTTLATVCRCVSHDWKRWGGEERHAVRWPAEVGISRHGWALGLAPVGACLSLPA